MRERMGGGHSCQWSADHNSLVKVNNPVKIKRPKPEIKISDKVIYILA